MAHSEISMYGGARPVMKFVHSSVWFRLTGAPFRDLARVVLRYLASAGAGEQTDECFRSTKRSQPGHGAGAYAH
jgi:hypothetical protein